MSTPTRERRSVGPCGFSRSGPPTHGPPDFVPDVSLCPRVAARAWVVSSVSLPLLVPSEPLLWEEGDWEDGALSDWWRLEPDATRKTPTPHRRPQCRCLLETGDRRPLRELRVPDHSSTVSDPPSWSTPRVVHFLPSPSLGMYGPH